MDQALQVVEEVKNYQVVKVVDETTRAQAANAIIELKGKRAQVIAFWKAPKENAYKAHQEIVSREKDMLKVVDGAIVAFDDSIKSYHREQERIRAEAQRKLEEDARKQREEERKRIEAEQEKALAAGDVEKALAIEEQAAAPVEAPKVTSIAQKTVKTESGTATATKDTFAEVVDAAAFLKHCGDNRLLSFHDVRLGAVKQWVKANALKDVPGLRIYEDFATQYRAAR
jgi:midasin (ATPase involved in ribosome maturation)